MKRSLLFIVCLFAVANCAFAQVEDTTFQDIDAVTVTSEREKKIVFEDRKYYIVDFTISDSRTLLLMKNLGKYMLYELDADMQFRRKLDVSLNVDGFFEDCFGNIHLTTRDSVFLVMEDEEDLALTETHPKRRFLSAMKKCVGSTSEKIIFESRTDFNQFQKFHTVDIDSGDRKVIYEISDSTMARSLKDAADLLIAESQMSPVNAGRGDLSEAQAGNIGHREMNARQDRMAFFQSHLTRPKYNPMFVVDDTLYFFNHAESRLDQMDDRGNLVSSRRIDHHRKQGWSKKVYSDRGTRRFYAVRSINGVQHLIGLAMKEDEQDFSSAITKHAYPKKVIIRNGIAYYTYKPNFDANLNKLYMQKL